MDRETLLPALIFMTLGIVIVVAIVQYFSVMRRKRMRQDTPLTERSEEQRRRGEGRVTGG